FSDARWSNEMFKRTALVGEFDYLASEIKWDEMERFKYFFKELFIKPQIQQLSIKKWGGFAPIDRKFRNNSEQGINRHYYYGSIVHTPSNIQINYLDSIRNLCEVKNIQLVLVSLPLHSSYWKKVP